MYQGSTDFLVKVNQRGSTLFIPVYLEICVYVYRFTTNIIGTIDIIISDKLKKK